MCEANAYLVSDGREKVIMESVDIIKPEDDGIYLENIFGEHLNVKARIKEMNLVDHRIFLVKEEGTVTEDEVDNNQGVI
jgi:predicted RNA-binding protein